MSTDQAGVLADLDAKMTELIGAPYTNLRSSIKDKLLTAIAYAVANFSGGTSSSTDALGTTGADVNVGNAAPPTTGQVLTATSATAATWQTPSGGGVSDGDKGDITVSGSGAVWTIDAGTITLAKMADLATDRLIGRDTAGTGVPEALTVTGGLEFTGSGGIQRSAITGDVTAPAGSGVTTLATVPATKGGTGITSYAVGDLLYADTTTTLAKLPDVATGKFLASKGVGVAPAWESIGGGSFGAILTTEEDMLIRRGGVVTRLPVGTQNGMALRVIGGLVTWGHVLMAVVASGELSETGTVGTTNSTRAGSIGQEGTIV